MFYMIFSPKKQGLYLRSQINVLDQFLANKNMVKQNVPIRVLPESVEILRFPDMVETGNYPKPIRFDGMGKPLNENGFSDHFPIAVTVSEAE